MEQPIEQPLGRQRRIDQFDVLDRLDQRAAFDPGVVLRDRVRRRTLPAHRPDRDRRTRARSGACGRNCSRMPPARQRWLAPPLAGAELLGDREPHARRDLLGAQEIFVRGILERAALERDQPLVAAHVGALVDGHREMAAAEQRARIGLARGHRGRDALLVEARAGPHLAGRDEVDHQHAHRPVGLRLQDEAALELQRGAEQHAEHDRLAEQLGDRLRDSRGRSGSCRPRARAAPHGRAGRGRDLERQDRVVGRNLRGCAAGYRDIGIGHATVI